MGMVLGVGIDMVSISEIERLDTSTKGAFVRRTYTERERADAGRVVSDNRYQFFAGRFAVKEAVYKAIRGTFPEIDFDFRHVETIKTENGAPRFVADRELQEIMESIGAKHILISISNENDYAIAIAELVG